MVAVTFESNSAALAYARDTDLQWPMLIDESRSLYTAYGMNRGSWWDIYGPQSWWIYGKLLAKGRRLQRPRGNFDQLGGDVLIDPEGIVRLHHVGRGPADRPSVAAIVAKIRVAENR